MTPRKRAELVRRTLAAQQQLARVIAILEREHDWKWGHEVHFRNLESRMRLLTDRTQQAIIADQLNKDRLYAQVAAAPLSVGERRAS
jgi:hypothetical protein